jgi:hypothetical protein
VEPIAFAGNDQQLYLVDAIGKAPRRLTGGEPERAYAWPVWAPGATVLAAMRHPRGTRLGDRAVDQWSLDGAPPRTLWATQDGGPICLYWAPDGQHLALLVQEDNDLHLLVAPRDGGTPARTLISGAPLYWGWTADSAAIVAHVGGHSRRAGQARVAMLPLDGAARDAEVLSSRPLGFRAPACEPGTRRVVFGVADDAGEGRLILADLAGGPHTELMEVGDEPAFVWAPQGGRLAVAARRDTGGPYESISILDVRSGATQAVSGSALAFFWTAEGDALIRANSDPAGDTLLWEYVDLATGAAERLALFTPTENLALLLSHFDQYAPAVHLWSREDASLLFADASQETRHNGHSPEHADVWLARRAGTPPLQHIGGGTIGFFGR